MTSKTTKEADCHDDPAADYLEEIRRFEAAINQSVQEGKPPFMSLRQLLAVALLCNGFVLACCRDRDVILKIKYLASEIVKIRLERLLRKCRLQAATIGMPFTQADQLFRRAERVILALNKAGFEDWSTGKLRPLLISVLKRLIEIESSAPKVDRHAAAKLWASQATLQLIADAGQTHPSAEGRTHFKRKRPRVQPSDEEEGPFSGLSPAEKEHARAMLAVLATADSPLSWPEVSGLAPDTSHDTAKKIGPKLIERGWVEQKPTGKSGTKYKFVITFQGRQTVQANEG